MMFSQKLYEQIEDYVLGRLSVEEMRGFEEQMRMDANLSKEVDFHRRLHQEMADPVKLQLTDQMKAIREENSERDSGGMGKYVYVILAAIILVVLWTLFSRNMGESAIDRGHELFAMYYDPYPAYFEERAGNGEQNVLFKAFTSYEKKEYQRALEGFNDALISSPEDTKITFYKAQCLVATGQLEPAINTFVQIIKHGDNPFIEQSNWYLGLIYCEKEEPAMAQEYLEIVANSSSPKKEDASRILDRLRR